MAEKLGLKRYTTPSGGCLLTDPEFSRRLRDHLEHEGKLTLTDVALLRVGRHFRIDGAKIIVGRNKRENDRLLSLARLHGFTYMKATEYKGPVTLCIGCINMNLLMRAAEITVRFSDSPKDIPVKIMVIKGGRREIIMAKALGTDELENLRI